MVFAIILINFWRFYHFFVISIFFFYYEYTFSCFLSFTFFIICYILLTSLVINFSVYLHFYKGGILMMLTNNQQFWEAYWNVFNKNRTTKLCGRNACRNLIFICQQIDPKGDYGNIETGFLNPKSIFSLAESLG